MRLANPINGDPMQNLRLLLTTYCLRRKQSILRQVVENITEIVRTLKFTNQERQNYEKIKRDCQNAIQDRLCHVGQQNYGFVFQTIMRLRLFCNLGLMGYTSVGNLDDPSRCTYWEAGVIYKSQKSWGVNMRQGVVYCCVFRAVQGGRCK